LNDAFFLTACALMACGWATAGLAEEPAKPGDKTEAKVAAKSEAGKAARVPDAADKPVVTVHSIEAGGKRISYAAETGMLPLLKDDGTAKASMFYVAYTLEGGDAARPIMFCFNGGPGASAVWLHLGGLG
jgi:carboxypeptidase C (cathepsin A)